MKRKRNSEEEIHIKLGSELALRKAMGAEYSCPICHIDFYVYRSDIHHASEHLPVTHCPFCGSPVEFA